ncbi:MAG TPA: hypothetical protein VI488_09415 [Candidatus Angelobacter sp.]
MALMLRCSARLVLVAAAISLAACSTRVFCQGYLWPQVPNLPYKAQVVRTGMLAVADGTRVRQETREFEARDSQGRTRIETFAPENSCGSRAGDPPLMVDLFDPSRRQFIQLFPGVKMARVMTFPGTGPIPTHGPNPNVVSSKTESLPGQTIHGTYAVGTRTTEVVPSDDRSGPDVVDIEETWVSPDLKIVVLFSYKSTDPRSSETTREIRQVDRSEPDAALFEIPADYKIVTVTTEPQADPPAPSPSTAGASTIHK